MYGWCSRYTQLKATQFFSVSQTPPLFLPPSPFPITPCITISPPFSPAAVTRATGNSKSCCWATAGSMRPALEKIEQERKRERERPSSLSTKRYYCLATIHGLPHLPHPHHPLSLSRKKKQAGHEKYTVRGPLQKIIMGCLRLRWLWSFGGKAYIMHKLPWDVW